MSWWYVVVSVLVAPCLVWFVKEAIFKDFDVLEEVGNLLFPFLLALALILYAIFYPWYLCGKWFFGKIDDRMCEILGQLTKKKQKLLRIWRH